MLELALMELVGCPDGHKWVNHDRSTCSHKAFLQLMAVSRELELSNKS